MALFKRKQSTSVLPEVDEYYQAQRRDRGWLSWLLAFVSVAIIVLLFVGLFLGGRWLYREVSNNNTTQQTSNTNEVGDTPALTVDGGPAVDVTTDGTTIQPEVVKNTQEGTVNAPVQTTEPNVPINRPIPSTGDDPLPATGPEGVLLVFVVVTIAATGLHLIISQKRSA